MGSSFGLGVTLHVQGDSALDVRLSADAVDGLLHLPVASVAPLHGIGGGRQERIVQERQRFLEARGEELLEGLADSPEAANASTQRGELSQRGVGAAAAVEEAVDLVHDPPQGAKGALASADPGQRALLGLGEVMLDEEVAMVEEAGDFLLESSLVADQAPLGRCGRATAAERGHAGLPRLAHLGHGVEHGFRELRDDVELTHLVGDRAEDLQDRGGVEGRGVRRDALQGEAAGLEGSPESQEEGGSSD